jgi:hypothetical protein
MKPRRNEEAQAHIGLSSHRKKNIYKKETTALGRPCPTSGQNVNSKETIDCQIRRHKKTRKTKKKGIQEVIRTPDILESNTGGQQHWI